MLSLHASVLVLIMLNVFFFLFPGEIIHVSAFSRLPAGVETWASVWNKSEDWRIEGRKIRLCLFGFFCPSVHSFLLRLVNPSITAELRPL